MSDEAKLISHPKIREVSAGIGSNQLRVKLSRNAPQSLQAIFNKKWDGHEYNMKRPAHCDGMYITLHAPPEEVLVYHRAQLDQVMAAAYAEYIEEERQKALEEERRKKQAQEDLDKRQKVIDDINKTLNESRENN